MSSDSGTRPRTVRRPFTWLVAASVLVAGMTGTASLAGAAGAQAVDAREAPFAARDSSGWVGVGLRAVPCGGGEENCVRPVVGSVILGSPAHRAGIRIGDRILSVGGDSIREGPHDAAFRTLRPGAPVPVVVQRSGRRVRLRMVPRERPDSLAVVRLAPSGPREAPRGVYVLALPEVQFRLEDRPFPTIPASPSLEGVRPRILRVVPTAREGELPRELVAARIEALREAMARAGARMPTPESAPERQERSPVVSTEEGGERTAGRPEGDGVESWSWSFSLENEAAHRAARQWRRWIDDSLRGHMERLHDSVLAAARSHMDSLARQAARGFDRSPGTTGSSVVVVGASRDRAAGAEFQPMSPELAEFFQGTGQGLLVLRVLPETPAARLGLRPGDVVVEAAGRRIRSVTDLRAVLSRDAAESVEVKWVRKGESVTGRLRD